MQRTTNLIRKGLLYIIALVLAAGYPLSAMAETQEPVTEPTTEVQTTEVVPPPEEPELTYTYDPTNEKWNSEKWFYNPATGAYEPTPAPVIVEPESEVTDESEASVDKTVETNVDITNNITSDAMSGNSDVIANTLAGNATTGDAAAVATLMNVVNSTVTAGDNQKVATFTQDILGDVKGDIILYPLLLKAMLEAQANPNPNTTLDATSNFNVNNNVDLTAASGDATVASNTTAGDATTGSATAVANVVNILNSMIAAQDSFIGTINIYGNLEGDILVAPDFIPQMLANNSEDENGSTQVSQETTTNIVNDISAVAESGAASVFGNTTGGDATTGSADTNVVIFNLTGHEIVAKNSLLVFVNVMGKWVGVIVDAPEGATAAMIGDGVTTNNQYAPDLTVNSQSNHGITNTIALDAQSGDATVANNTTAGNAVSGQAMAMANVANISGNQFGMTNWFGVLFINVFQNWYGSFGVNTAYGDPVTEEKASAPTGPIQFIPAASETTQTNVRSTIIDTRTIRSTEALIEAASEQAVLASSAATNADDPVQRLVKQAEEPQDYRIWIVAGSLFLIGLSAIGLRRLLQM